jgi:hypothetical protein
VNDSAVAAVVRERLVVKCEELSDDEQETFRKIRNATDSEQAEGYRPWSDEPVPDQSSSATAATMRSRSSLRQTISTSHPA